MEDISQAEFEGRFDALAAKALTAQCNSENRVHLNRLKLSQSAMVTLGMSIKQIAFEYGLEEFEVKKEFARASVHVVSGDLIFVFESDSLDADCIVVIPAGYWKYIDEPDAVQ